MDVVRLILFLLVVGVASAVTVTNARLTVPDRVIPHGVLVVELSLHATNVPLTTTLTALFATGSDATAVAWSRTVLEQISRDGDNFVLSRALRAPSSTGVYSDMAWVVVRADTHEEVSGVFHHVKPVEVTCSDGVYCNGEERYVNGLCERSPLPCVGLTDDPCSTYHCIESNASCSFAPVGGSDCLTCLVDACAPDCGDRVCGDDGCGGECGVCDAGQSCLDGTCVAVTQKGTCEIPAPLLENLGLGSAVPGDGFVGIIYGDNSGGVDAFDLACGMEGVKEYVYAFTIDGFDPMGFEIIALDPSGDACAFDSVIAVHGEDCGPVSISGTFCSDDASPPGCLGSRVFGQLEPGEYRLVVSSYAPGTENAYVLHLKFTPNCLPECYDKYCGSDGCGGLCGVFECAQDETCDDETGRCGPLDCVPSCDGRACGDDGCNGTCGACKAGKICDAITGVCAVPEDCDHAAPLCGADRGDAGFDAYCGTDCAWHGAEEPLPDLTVAVKAAAEPSVVFSWDSFDKTSCAVRDGCVSGPGQRLLLKFALQVSNVGPVDFEAPAIEENPGLFAYSVCQNEFMIDEFVSFALRNSTAGYAIGGKAELAPFCVEDTDRHSSGPTVPCDPQFDCSRQGVSTMSTGTYPVSRDCQWVDVTDVLTGCWYNLEVCVNANRRFAEYTYDNNCATFSVYVGDVPTDGESYSYSDLISRDSAYSFFPGCKA